MSKIKLNVLGISYSQTQSGAYALVLAEEEGERRIPIIIGGFEAQAIAIQLEGLKPPRPLTHDLFLSFASAFGISIAEINIYKLEEGVFYSKLICDDGKKQMTVDARTSDAIALALRFSCSIYTTEEILAKSGIVIDIEPETKEGSSASSGIFTDPQAGKRKPGDELRDFSLSELKEMLQDAIKNENYEKASDIRDEINHRNKKS
ncbi:MAG: hypothetical protein EA408_13635 [Marinilabiliales bacterium]|nr:MAG: hypothetical protein EA408_13635 [Marinilabiliales bacterium]